MFEFITKEITISPRKLLVNILLFSNTLAWFYIFYVYLLDLLFINSAYTFSYTSVGNIIFLSFSVISAILGSIISEKVERKKLLGYWIFFGLIATLSILIFQGVEYNLFLSALLGLSFGFGFPTTQAIFTDSTRVEERGRIAGLLIFITFSFVISIFLLVDALGLGLFELVLICAAIKASSFFALIIDHSKPKKGLAKSWISIIKSKTFYSYVIPWLIFHFANGLVLFGKLTPEIAEIVAFSQVFEYSATLITALIVGLLIDRVGRKQPMLIGLLFLGASYALLGLVTTIETFFIYMFIEGIAWGLIAVSYMVVILGDISAKFKSKEKFYTLGGMMIPFLTVAVFSIIQQTYQISIPLSSLSTVLSIIIFMSVIPLLRAPETLPQIKIRKRKIREQVEKLEKIIQDSKKPK